MEALAQAHAEVLQEGKARWRAACERMAAPEAVVGPSRGAGAGSLRALLDELPLLRSASGAVRSSAFAKATAVALAEAPERALRAVANAVAETLAEDGVGAAVAEAALAAAEATFSSGRAGALALAATSFAADAVARSWGRTDMERAWRLARRCAAVSTRAKLTNGSGGEAARLAATALLTLAASANCVVSATTARPAVSAAAASAAADCVNLLGLRPDKGSLAARCARDVTAALAAAAGSAGLVDGDGDCCCPTHNLVDMLLTWARKGSDMGLGPELPLLASAMCALAPCAERMLKSGAVAGLLQGLRQHAARAAADVRKGGGMKQRQLALEARCRLIACLVRTARCDLLSFVDAVVIAGAVGALDAISDDELLAGGTRKWASAARAQLARAAGRLHVGLSNHLGSRLRALLPGGALAGVYADLALPHGIPAHAFVLASRCPALLAAARGEDNAQLVAAQAAGSAALASIVEWCYTGEARLVRAGDVGRLVALAKALALPKLVSATLHTHQRLPAAVGTEAISSPVAIELSAVEEQYSDFGMRCADGLVRVSLALWACHSPLFDPRIRNAFAHDNSATLPPHIEACGVAALGRWLTQRTLPADVRALASAAAVADFYMLDLAAGAYIEEALCAALSSSASSHAVVAAALVAAAKHPFLAGGFGRGKQAALKCLAQRWSELDAEAREGLLCEQVRGQVQRMRLQVLS